MSIKLQPVRGTHDILPEESRKRRFIVDTWQRVAQAYGYGEIQTPMFETSEVFHRTLGDTSDVVTKETYSFTDRGGESLTLRPEFTAAVVRAFISEGLTQDLPQKFFYHGPAFRYERPQKGRLRQFHQVGVELLGAAEPEADVETIALAAQGLRTLGLLKKTTLQINTLGDAESRKNYRGALVEYFTGHRDALSEDSRARLEKNPLRILDSKDPQDKPLVAHAPSLHHFLTADAAQFYAAVNRGLGSLGIAVIQNPRLVRGLDYYNHTVFEFVAADGLGAQNTVLAGGRYDGLVAQMGGPEIPGVGWAAGIERMLALMDDAAFPPPASCVAVIPVGETTADAAWKLAQDLREAGIAVDMSYRGNVGKRMKRADKIGAGYAVMLGEDELKAHAVALKNLATGEQKIVPQAELITLLKMDSRLRGNDKE